MKMRLLTTLAAAALLAACAAGPDQPRPAPLLETYWRAVELESIPVTIKPKANEPYLVLRSDRSSVNGYAGCNTFRGIYDRDDNKLRFRGLATTLMACEPQAGELEKRFLSALQASDTQRITGNTLELQDVEGKTRARFEVGTAAR